MPHLLEGFRTFFIEQGVEFDELPDLSAVRLGLKGAQGTFTCVAQTDEEQRVAYVQILIADPVPEDRRAAMAEFLVRVNCGVRMGCFDMDYADGEVRFRIAHGAADGPFTDQMVRTMTGFSLLMAERYHEALVQVMSGRAPGVVLAERVV